MGDLEEQIEKTINEVSSSEIGRKLLEKIYYFAINSGLNT